MILNPAAWNPEWGLIYYKASITAQGLPESSSLRGSALGTRLAEHKGCNWDVQVDWWLQPKKLCSATLSGICHRNKSQLNCMQRLCDWVKCVVHLHLTQLEIKCHHRHSTSHTSMRSLCMQTRAGRLFPTSLDRQPIWHFLLENSFILSLDSCQFMGWWEFQESFGGRMPIPTPTCYGLEKKHWKLESSDNSWNSDSVLYL